MDLHENILYKKDSKALCPYCKDHYFTFNRNIFAGELVDPNDVYKDRGQAPFTVGQKMICKKCGGELTVNALIFVDEKIQNNKIAINYIKWLLPYAHLYLQNSNEWVNLSKQLDNIRKFIQESEK